MNDFRYGVRNLRKHPGFTAVAMTALALGIGANTSIFSVVNSVLLRPLAYHEPERLVMVWENHRGLGLSRNVVSPANFLDWEAQTDVFEGMAAVRDLRSNLTGLGEPEELQGQIVSAGFFNVLGARPALGRTFLPQEERPAGPQVVVLSHRLWQRRFGSDPSIIGRSLTLSGVPTTVIGVMGADFPALPTLSQWPEIWGPIRLDPASDYRAASGRYLVAAARLKSGVTLRQAQSEMDLIAGRLARQYPDFNKGWGVTLIPLHEQYVGELRPALVALLGAAGFVLFIACADVANLQLVRAVSRQGEMAVRASLGAGRWRLIRQLLAEGALLALAGGALGLLLAVLGVRALIALAPSTFPRLDYIRVDGPALGFTLAISIITGVLFGLVPAGIVSRTNLTETLKEGGARSGTGRRSQWLRRALVVSEVALSLVLLVGAGLMVLSFLRLQAVDPGFRPENLLTLRLVLPSAQYPKSQQWVSFFDQAIARIQALPGVHSAGAISFLPFSGRVAGAYFTVEGRPVPEPTDRPVSDIAVVTPTYFATMRIPLLRGRVFNDRDTADAARVFVVNQAIAQRQFPNEDPVGKRMTVQVGSRMLGQIVGVVGDVKHHGLDSEVRPMIFYPAAQLPNPYMVLVVRTASNPRRMSSSVIAQIQSLDPNQPVAEVRPMEEVLSRSVSRARFSMLLFVIFAIVALALAIAGIYGVMSYTVTQRTHEIGIRMALGAAQSDVMRMVIGQGVTLGGVGVAIGLGGSLALSRLISGFLFGVSSTDPGILCGTAVLLLAVSLAAAWVPARRASRVDPTIALRQQ